MGLEQALCTFSPSFLIQQPHTMPAPVRARRATRRTPIAFTAHETTGTAAGLGLNAVSGYAETNAVGIDFDRLNHIQQRSVDDVVKSVNGDHDIRFFGFFQRDAKAANAAVSQFDKQPDRAFLLVFKVLADQPGRPGCHLQAWAVSGIHQRFLPPVCV
jgi:hypothetical protein